jgi:selenocysteine-specific elongation factor
VRRFLVGTAGHIDHGKTALVKALTGIDADRLPEEKRRGITIDLGFAHAEWDGVRVSFVDVPGHEKFVRNMLAGAGGIDAVLLVVAADESVMPQTREHFEIVRMLGIPRGVIAVTKIDRVAADLLAVTREDLRELVAGSFLEAAPVVAVSSRTGEGLDELRRALLSLARPEEEALRAARAARLPIDRAFLIAGFGPVVTGSLVAGTLRRDEKVELLPERRPVRLRRLEVHGRETDEARAGERVSANLAGVEFADLARGKTLATPGACAVSALLTARVDWLPTARPARSGDRFFLHHLSSETRARLRLLDGGTLAPGGSARAQLVLSSPIAALPGDRFVLRRLSPVETVGGGVVLDPLWPPVARGRVGEREKVAVLESGDLAARSILWIEQARERGAGEEDLASRAGVSAPEIRKALGPARSEGSVAALRTAPDRYIAGSVLGRLAARAVAEIAAFLGAADASGSVGMPRGTLLARLLPEAEPRWAEAVEAALAARGIFRIVGEEARPPGREDLPPAERELSERIVAVFRERGLDPPSPAEVAERVRHRQKVVEGLLGYLAKKGELARLPGGWLVAREAVDGVVARLRASGRKSLDVGEFKEMFGLTRRLAIPLLEHLDQTRVTRRVGDRREILPSS